MMSQKKSLEELHQAAYNTIDKFDNYNYDDDEDVIHWQPVSKPVKDVEFEKQIAKLKAVKRFNQER